LLKTTILKKLKQWRLVAVIAKDVRRSALKERMLYGFLLLALLFVLMANVPFIVKDPKVFDNQPPEVAAVQIGFVSINIFILLIAIFISLTTLQNFLAKEKLALLLSKPVWRWQIIEGIILGLYQMIFLNWFLLTAGVWLVVFSHTKSLSFYIWQGMSVTALLAFFYVTLVVFFYCILPNIMAGLFTFFMLIAGFGVNFAHDMFARGPYPFFLRKSLILGLNVLPKINDLWGVSMRSLKLFRIDVHPTPIILHTILLIIVLNILTSFKFRRFGRT
jgi:ABC-type transport system involved in multi-copper enzyme maturation permease subunit